MAMGLLGLQLVASAAGAATAGATALPAGAASAAAAAAAELAAEAEAADSGPASTFDVLKFGAAGDGTKSDSVPIVRALTAAAESQGPATTIRNISCGLALWLFHSLSLLSFRSPQPF